MKELLEFIVTNLTGQKEVKITEENEEGRITFQIHADSDSIGLIIGKNGSTIKAIQEILRVRARLEKTYVFVNVVEA